MSQGERAAWSLAGQGVFGAALAMLAAVLLLGLDGDEAPGRRAPGVIEASGAPVVTLSRTVRTVPVSSPPAPQEVAAPGPEPTVTAPAPAPAPAGEPIVALEAGADPSPPTTAGPFLETTSTTATRSDAAVTTAPPTTAPPTTPPPSTVAATTTTTVAAAPVPASGPVRTPSVEAEVVPLTNRDRSAQGLGTLSRDGCLDGVASGYAVEMARTGVLAHNPDAGNGVAGCRPGATWGDNVGTAAPCSAALLEERWMASPSHRRNILTASFRYVGVGAWTDAAGSCWVQVLFSS